MKSFAPAKARRACWLLTCLFLLAVATSCAMQEMKLPVAPAPAQAASQVDAADGNLSGLWIGTTTTGGLVGMAGRTRSIKLVIRQFGDKITGSYRCSAGNSMCRNQNQQGSIEGKANGNQVRLNILVLPDASNCRYIGTLDYNGNGQYTCYLQGRIVEQGIWQASK